ncbi:short-chain dehydrogenase/reductase [Nonlabens sp. MB-3u-79]|jgi:NADP-dependent 3-hydroxy acid dehydrogenase YdfG|uniref:SDR family oxidoreductase n=1 Tax=Nonlabens sp. MB-3u-79 TaxID=2058134 RepID=UPI000C3108F5|nr:SDR family oxidoreductase [Nonlabens sp. MB-3u-79]AUC79992.1 short-chain dehydrogenase/reductase [Nonlabens sp. MB-3u-79]|tara:strand:+ start:1078 stop:1890 length:813 start_codon:yes stop_codon:yes gene_type:complete
MNKTILITGTSSGIGKATAIYFQQKGWNVIATMRSPEKDTELKELENVLLEKLDVLDLESINQAIQNGIEKFGKIDALVNNAGYGAYGPLESFPRENIIKQFNTNVIGLMDVTKAIIPHFRANKDGVIVNISSIGGQMTFALGSLYHGTKFAVEGISESLHYEMKEIGVKVKIVEPGMIATDFGGRSFDFQAGEIADYQPIIGALMKQWQNPDNSSSAASLVADVIYTAVSDDSEQLRYRAGDDANFLLDSRKKMTDNEFFSMMNNQMGK